MNLYNDSGANSGADPPREAEFRRKFERLINFYFFEAIDTAFERSFGALQNCRFRFSNSENFRIKFGTWRPPAFYPLKDNWDGYSQ